MRKFSSYGPVDLDLHYYAPRTELIEQTYHQLRGADPAKGGHYITVWAPRQTGKTWLLQQVVQRLRTENEFDVAILTLQSAKTVTDEQAVLAFFVKELRMWFGREFAPIKTWQELADLFTDAYFTRPLILILDEFDALAEPFINRFANEFRAIYTRRSNQLGQPSQEKIALLHGLALIGVRSVLGIENVTGSPFNVQRSIHIPNLTQAEVAAMFRWYEKESGQQVEQAVVDRLFYETRGQPGLVGWFGELLTETYNRHDTTITAHDFEIVFAVGLNLLPNNNILNIISKAKEQPYVDTVFQLFKTDQKLVFSYDDPHLNFLYLNGVIDQTSEDQSTFYVRFASPFVQKRLFNYFARQFFGHLGRLYDPLGDLTDTITETTLSVPHLLRRYEVYLRQNHTRLIKNAPRRESDNRVFEAIFHFNLYTYLYQFLADFDGRVVPEFPTGNGKINLLITYANRLYGVEVKSFINRKRYQEALGQAARYAQQLQQTEIWLAFFIDTIDDANRQQLETPYQDAQTGVQVQPIFVIIGE
jgi:AAA-like domain